MSVLNANTEVPKQEGEVQHKVWCHKHMMGWFAWTVLIEKPGQIAEMWTINERFTKKAKKITVEGVKDRTFATRDEAVAYIVGVAA